MTTFSSSQHRGGVYSVSWGPTLVGEGEGLALYSCGDGKVIQHNIKTGKGVDIQETIDKANSSEGSRPAGRSQVLWMERGGVKLLLLGCEDGTIEIYRVPSLSLAATLKSQAKLIQSLAVHPEHLTDGTQCTEFGYYLASASNEFPVHVFDLSPVFHHPDTSPPLCIISPTKVLTGHLHRVIELSWSPHTQARLLSVSYDFSGQVWDLETGEPLHNFQGHQARVMCCLWHPSQDMVLTGGEEGVLHGWVPHQQPDKLPIDKKRDKRSKSAKPDGVQEASINTVKDEEKDNNGPLEPKQELSFDELLAKHKAEQSKTRDNTNIEPHNASPVEAAMVHKEDRAKKIARKEAKKSMFPVSNAAEIKSRSKVGNDCIKIHQINQSISKTGASSPTADTVTDDLASLSLDTDEVGPHLGLFTFSRDLTYKLLEAETAALSSEPELSSQLSLWSGDLGTVIENAIAGGKMTARLLGLSAGISTALWRRAARALGTQLIRAGEVLRGAEYLVSAGSVREAVEEMYKAGQYRSALAVAHSRLPAGDPLTKEILSVWARQCNTDGNFALAARCWVGTGDLVRGAECLARLGDHVSLRAAALLLGTDGRGPVYARQALTNSLYSGDFITCSQLLAEQTSLTWAKPLCSVHRLVLQAVNGDGSVEQGQGLLQIVRKELTDPVGEEERQELITFLAGSTHTDKVKNTLLQVSGHLCQSLPPSSLQSSLGHVAQCLHLLHRQPPLLAALIPVLLPGGAQAPSAGLALLGQPLDWQCNWPQLRSIQSSEGLSLLNSLEKDRDKSVTEEELELLADSFMLEDVILQQKLEAEIAEGEKEVEKFKPNPEVIQNGDVLVKKDEGEASAEDEGVELDLTPSLGGTQTLSLSGPDGHWKSEGVGDTVPLPGVGDQGDLPPPPPPSRSFRQRFLADQANTDLAVKELQKLKWTLNRRRVTNTDSPFPCLSLACSRLISLMVSRKLGNPPSDQADDEQNVARLGLKQRVARWSYYNGLRTMQEFFVQHS